MGIIKPILNKSKIRFIKPLIKMITALLFSDNVRKLNILKYFLIKSLPI